MTTPSPAPKKRTPQKRNSTADGDKTRVLAIATEVLSNRVATLADAVQTNNYKIDMLQAEVNKKPDDEEVRFITGLATAERNRHLGYALITALLSAGLAGLISYMSAQNQLEERTKAANALCKLANQRTGILVERFEQFARDDENPTQVQNLTDTAMKLKESLVNCDVVQPLPDN